MKKGKLLATLLCSASMVMGSMVPTVPAMADAMKKYSENGKLTEIAVQLILCEEKKDTGKVTIPANRISRYFPKDYSKQQMEQVIFELLEDWRSTMWSLIISMIMNQSSLLFIESRRCCLLMIIFATCPVMQRCFMV